MKGISRIVILLSLVSFFADISSEMLYPVMPLFMESLGAGALVIGLLEGLAGLLSGFGKAWFGSLSDLLNRRNIFIRGGYFLSAISKPLIGLFPYLGVIFGARALDRLGKGMRTPARDAVLIRESDPENRGRVFGFHRGLDTLGAVIGPLIALLWLHYYPSEYEWLFVIAFAPGMIGVLLTVGLQREPQVDWQAVKKVRPFAGVFGFWKEASPEYKRLLAGFLLFSLINSSDFFLLLKASDSGLSPGNVIGAYIFYNLVYALASFPMGILGDRRGFKPVFLLSVLIYAITYLGFGLVTSPGLIWLLFATYGLFTAANEGIAKSWISLHIPKDKRATGLGLFLFLNTLMITVASPLAGLVWNMSTGKILFLITGGLAFILLLLLTFLLPANRNVRVEK